MDSNKITIMNLADELILHIFSYDILHRKTSIASLSSVGVSAL